LDLVQLNKAKTSASWRPYKYVQPFSHRAY
jgi:hypothetical protein